MRAGTVLASLAHTVLRAYEGTGGTSSPILRDVMGDPQALADAESRLPFDAYTKLWDVCGTASGDPDFGLRAARETLQAETFGVVGFMARTAPTLGDALRAAVRHGALLNETSRTQLFVDGEHAVLRDGPADPGTRWPRHKAEFVMAAYVLLTFEWAGVGRQPVAVSFQHSGDGAASAYHQVFCGSVTFDAPFNELRFPASWLSRPIASAEPALFAFLERRAAELGSSLQAALDLRQEVCRVVAAALPQGVPSIECVARRLGTGHRTLQRRLQEQGTGYRELVDDLRFERCQALLVDDALTVDVVSSRLGFSNARAFRRAVRRWSGLSPRGLRAHLA